MKTIFRLIIAAVALGLLAACAPAATNVLPVASSTSPSQPEVRTPASRPASPPSTPSAEAIGIIPTIHYRTGSPVTFAVHTQLAGYGFLWGPSDGAFGAIPINGDSYTFYGTAASSASCAGTPRLNGTYTFVGTLDRVTGSNCARLFGPGDAPPDYTFDRDYAGGGQVVRFVGEGKRGWLMPFHGEFHWKDMDNPPSYWCHTGKNSPSMVPCFYSSIGLAVSLDDGKTFKVAGQILQPSQPLSVFQGSTNNMDVGYGALVVADANGKHLDNPPSDPQAAFFYLVYADRLPGLPGLCANLNCAAIARAPYVNVVSAALSGDPRRLANVFHKYDAAAPDSWSQPATAWVEGSDTPDLSGTAGRFSPLWIDEGAYEPQVIYDKSFDVYLIVYPWGGGPQVRASRDLIHWSEPIGPTITEPGHALLYPTLVGETGDPTIGGPAPRLYFSSFVGNSFPDYTQAVFESVQLTLSWGR